MSGTDNITGGDRELIGYDYGIVGDMHTHTLASTHAYSTVKEMAEAAKSAGLEFLAITDHTPGIDDAPHIWHFHNMHRAIPRELFGVKIVYGAEANVIDYEGHIDFSDEDCAALDWIVASVHRCILPCQSIELNTQTYVGLAENKYVDVIGHCANAKFPFDIERAVKAFKEHDKLVEINENTLLWRNSEPIYREIIPLCKKYRVSVIVNTDAHFFTAVGKVSESLRLLRETDYPKELIVNINRDLLIERLNRRKGYIFS